MLVSLVLKTLLEYGVGMSEYAVFIMKDDKVWRQASIPSSYADAQGTAKLVRRGFAFVKKTRVRRLPPVLIPELE